LLHVGLLFRFLSEESAQSSTLNIFDLDLSTRSDLVSFDIGFSDSNDLVGGGDSADSVGDLFD
jgi:hypothetical protein